VLLQEPDVRGHVRVNLREVCLVDELNDEHTDRSFLVLSQFSRQVGTENRRPRPSL
jgi:hypothetical protein